jgi:cbb3-type cytochrome oxidase subunit 3
MDPIGIFFMLIFLILVLVAVIYPQMERNKEG